MLTLQATVPRAQGRHIWKLRCTAPDGSPAPWFDRSVIVGKQGTQLELPLAHNEQTGEWTVEATDLFTGKTGVSKFEVRR